MDNQLSSRKLFRYASIILGIILLSVISLSIFNNIRFRAVKFIPKSSGVVASSVSAFAVDFNKELKPDVDYKSSAEDPQKIIRSIAVEEKRLLLLTDSLVAGRKYDFSLHNIQAKDGRVVKTIKYSFVARFIPENQLPKEVRELQIAQTDVGNFTDPLVDRLPYGGLHFSLSASHEASSAEENTVIINARLILSRSDVKTNRQAAIDRYKAEVEQYIRSLGLDPAKYNIRYETVEPSFY